MSETSAMFDFTGAAVLVTGSSRGLGAGIARVFATAGASVILHCHTDREGAESIRSSLPGPGTHAVTRADLTDEREVSRMAAEVARLCGAAGLAILVNNAGTYPSAPLLELDIASWRAVLDANLTSTHAVTRAMAPLMREGASIVNIASVEAGRPVRGHAHYSAAKAAVIRYTEAAALELAPRGIRVNSVSPGLIDRPGLAEAWPDGVRRFVEAAPLGRAGRPEEIGWACLFLASRAASWITGTNLAVDGGAGIVAPQDERRPAR